MALNWKRILILIGFLLIVVLIGYLLYFFFLKPTIPLAPPTNVNIPAGILPPAGVNVNIPVGVNVGVLPPGANVNIGVPSRPGPMPPGAVALSPIARGGLTETRSLTTTRGYGVTLGNDGSSILYYDKTTGQFFRLTADGRQLPLTDKIFYQVEKITWAPGKEKAVLEYPDGVNIVYDFKTKKQVTLPAHWKDFSFSPNNERLVFKSIGTDPENRFLAISKADGSEAEQIEPLGDKDATVYPAWSPNEQIIAMYTEGKDFDNQYLYFLGLNNENFKSVTINGRNFQGVWSPQGDRLLYSAYSSSNDFKPMLWIVSAQGENIGLNRRSLNLQTWANKCTFSNNDKIYCAVPQNLQEGAGIFYQQLDNSPTDVYEIDLSTGFKSMIATPQGDHNIENLVVSQDGRYLYFTSKTDGRLYQIQLK